MQRGILIVQTDAKPGTDAEFNEWYHGTHIPEILGGAGMTSARRFQRTPISQTEVSDANDWLPYLAIYEVEAEDLRAAVTATFERFARGEMSTSDLTNGTRAQVYELVYSSEH